MDSVAFMLRRMREELRVMEANSEQRTARFDIDFDDGPVFDSYSDDLGGPVFDSYPDDLGDGPIFDEDPFVDPVGDAAHDSDNVAVTMLDQGSDNLSAALAGVVFNEDPKHDESELVIGQDFAPPATIVDTPSKCSPKCLHLAVHAEKTFIAMPLQEFKGITSVRVLDSICKVFNSYGFSIGDCGELFLYDCGVPILVHDISMSDSAANVWCESKYWDPGLAGDLRFRELSITRWVVHSCAAFHWDPGSPDRSKAIVLTRSCADVGPNCFHWLILSGLTQQKCGGCLGRDIDWYMLDSARSLRDIWGILGCKFYPDLKLLKLLLLYNSLLVQMAYGAQWLCLIMLQWSTFWLAIHTAMPKEGHQATSEDSIYSLHMSEVPWQFCVSLPDAAFSKGNVVIKGILLQHTVGILLQTVAESTMPILLYSSSYYSVVTGAQHVKLAARDLDFYFKLSEIAEYSGDGWLYGQSRFWEGLILFEATWQFGHLVYLVTMLKQRGKPDIEGCLLIVKWDAVDMMRTRGRYNVEAMGVLSPLTLCDCSPTRLLAGLLQEATWSSCVSFSGAMPCSLLKAPVLTDFSQEGLKPEAILQRRLVKKGNAAPVRDAAAYEVFDGMSTSSAVGWDEELLSEVESHDSVLEQLALSANYLVHKETKSKVQPNIDDRFHIDVAFDDLKSISELKELLSFSAEQHRAGFHMSLTSAQRERDDTPDYIIFVGHLAADFTSKVHYISVKGAPVVKINIPVGQRCDSVQFVTRPYVKQEVLLLQGTWIGGDLGCICNGWIIRPWDPGIYSSTRVYGAYAWCCLGTSNISTGR